MDSVTQALLGATVGEITLGQRLGNKAVLIGAIVATVPDLDVILIPFYDNLEKISIHRGWSHSVPINILFSIALSWLLFRLFRRKLSYWRWYLFCNLALLTHVFLDAFTAYGTQLWQPFSNSRVAWDSIPIVDPFYSLWLIVGLLLAMVYRRKKALIAKRAAVIGLAASCLYLSYTLWQKQGVEHAFRSRVESMNIGSFEMITIPVSPGGLLWYGAVKTDEGLFLADYSVFDTVPTKFLFFENNESSLVSYPDQEMVEVLKWFADGFYVAQDRGDHIRFYNMKCDMTGPMDDEQAPTSFYYRMDLDGEPEVSSQMHKKNKGLFDQWKHKFERITRDF